MRRYRGCRSVGECPLEPVLTCPRGRGECIEGSVADHGHKVVGCCTWNVQIRERPEGSGNHKGHDAACYMVDSPKRNPWEVEDGNRENLEFGLILFFGWPDGIPNMGD